MHKHKLALLVAVLCAVGLLLPVSAADEPDDPHETHSSVVVSFYWVNEPSPDETGETPVPQKPPGGGTVSRPDNSGSRDNNPSDRDGDSESEQDGSLPFESYREVSPDLVYVLEPPVPTQHLGELPKTGSNRRSASILIAMGLTLVALSFEAGSVRTRRRRE